MAVMLSQEDIDKLLKEIELAFKIPSIIDVTPAEIACIRDDATRKSMERKFHLINELFITPLQKLLNKSVLEVNHESYSYDYSPYSLTQRMRLIAKDLLIYGYKSSYLATLLPHTVEEVEKKAKEIESRQSFQVIDAKKQNTNQRKIA